VIICGRHPVIDKKLLTDDITIALLLSAAPLVNTIEKESGSAEVSSNEHSSAIS
jgi:hypothetical protein